jgi:hypothetical protein
MSLKRIRRSDGKEDSDYFAERGKRGASSAVKQKCRPRLRAAGIARKVGKGSVVEIASRQSPRSRVPHQAFE